MAWTAPLTATVGAVLTAAQWNATVRDNLLETAVAKATTAGGYFVATGVNALAERQIGTAEDLAPQSTTSTSYTTLNSGPSVTVTTGTRALVWYSLRSWNNTAGQNAYTSIMISGATSAVAADTWGLFLTEPTSNYVWSMGRHYAFTSLTPGSNTFTMQHRVTGGTGNWDDRSILVMPL